MKIPEKYESLSYLLLGLALILLAAILQIAWPLPDALDYVMVAAGLLLVYVAVEDM